LLASASGVLKALTMRNPTRVLGETTAGFWSRGAAMGMEIVLTFLFLVVILGVTSKRASSAPAFGGLAIGLYLAAAHIVGIPFSGASLNPARSLGPAVFVGGDALAQLWIYIVGPCAGAIAGAIAHKLLGSDEG
jgi:aquaporin Z